MANTEMAKPKGEIQIGIGLVVGVLLLMAIGAEIFSVYTEYSILNNRELLIEMGYNPDSFSRPTTYWVSQYSFHLFGLISLLLYLVFVAVRKSKISAILFVLCLAYFLICAIINIADLTPEQEMRGYTMGGWIARVIVWLPRYIIELGLLVQGLLGVRKYDKSSI